jgi:polyphenol oxidase
LKKRNYMELKNNFLIPFWKENFKNIAAGFTLPEHGNFALTRKSISTKTTTVENRENLAKTLNFDNKRLFYPHLIHSDIVIEVNEENIRKGAFTLDEAIQGDACITVLDNALLLITWADCIPVILYEPESSWIGAVHSGWKGTLLEILPKTIEKMKNKGVKVEKLFAAVGPGIRDCCYNVGEDFVSKFEKSGLSTFLDKKGENVFFDLAGSVYHQLKRCGVKEENIDFFGRCNSCSVFPKFFSCRRDKENFEAQAAFIGKYS